MRAFLREVSPRVDRRDTTTAAHSSIDVKVARKQHDQFVETLKGLGVRTEFVAPAPDQPDGVFVDSAAVVLPEVAVIARPDGNSNQPDIDSVAAIIGVYRPAMRIFAPALLDGSDVLRIGHTLFVGLSRRTNTEAVSALTEIVDAFGYQVRTVELRDCSRLKSACTFIPPHFLVANPACVDAKTFGDLVVIPVDEREPLGANTLTVAGTTLVSSAFPKTRARLRDAGVTTQKIDVSEFHKLDAGLSRLALIVEPRVARPAVAPLGLKVVQPTGTPPMDSIFAPALVHGGLVYVSGQLPIDPESGRPVAGDVDAQTNQALANLTGLLTASGSAPTRILRLTFYLADPKHVERVLNVCARMLNGHKPAGSIVPAKTLQPGCAVAVDAIAAVIEESA